MGFPFSVTIFKNLSESFDLDTLDFRGKKFNIPNPFLFQNVSISKVPDAKNPGSILKMIAEY